MKITVLSSVSVVRGGAVPPMSSGRPWASSVSGAGYGRVQAPISGPAVVTARTATIAVPRRTPAIPRLIAVPAELPSVDIRKKHTHKTRVNAGGDGAMGPHPEREPA